MKWKIMKSFHGGEDNTLPINTAARPRKYDVVLWPSYMTPYVTNERWTIILVSLYDLAH